MTENISAKETMVFWQEGQEDGIAEPAISMEGFSDTITLTQNGNRINLNYESLSEFIRNLKNLKILNNK